MATRRFQQAFGHVATIGGTVLTAAAAVLSHKLWPVIVGGGLEAAWIAVATRPVVADKLQRRRRGRERKKREARWRVRFETLVAGANEGERARLTRLESRRREIVDSAQQNPRFIGGLLEDEIEKLREIVEAFAHIVTMIGQWERHLAKVDFDGMESEMRQHETEAARAIDPAQRELSRQSLAILMERQAQLAALREKLGHARKEVELMESSLKLVADKVHVMTSPQDVGRELADLLVGVEAMREMTTTDRAAASAAMRQIT